MKQTIGQGQLRVFGTVATVMRGYIFGQHLHFSCLENVMSTQRLSTNVAFLLFIGSLNNPGFDSFHFQWQMILP